MDFLSWLEELSFSRWLNESPSVWAFPMFLFAHTLGMSVVAGGSTVVNLAILGVWPQAPLRPLARFSRFSSGDSRSTPSPARRSSSEMPPPTAATSTST